MKYKVLFFLSTLLWLCSCKEPADKIAFNLQCEYLTAPLGVDVSSPRLSWSIPQIKGMEELPVQVFLSPDSLAVERMDKSCLYKTLSPLSIGVKYEKVLQQEKTYYWRIAMGNHASEVTSFTTAYPIQAPWISDGENIDYLPSSFFKKNIQINRPLKRAYWVIASAGLHELYINGEKVGDHYLDPMYTHFDKRILSVTHDVTDCLDTGENELRVQLGNGWYNHQSKAVWFFDRASWRGRPCFTARLALEYADGSKEDILTDTSWQRADSPTIFNSIYTAEHYDARLKDKTPEWKPVKEVESPTAFIKSQLMHPARVTSVLKASAFKKLNDSLYIYSFPKNMAGITRLNVRGESGTVLRLKHGEMLYEDGRVNMGNIDYHYRPVDDYDPFQTDIVILSGETDTFEPKFNYKGFQHVEVSASAPVAMDENSLIALELHSDVPVKGTWHSSSDLLNKIWEATNNAYLSNLFGYPTDCPQREKNGWTGDAHIAIDVALYNYDAITVYEKWLADFVDAQQENGVLPCIIPTSVWGFDWANGVDWTSAVVIIPWEIYRYYGDDTLLNQMYEPMKRYVDYITSISKNKLTDWGLGDWIPVKTTSDIMLTTSIYYYVDVDIMAKASKLLGKKEEYEYYSKLAAEIRQAINEKYLDKETAIYASGTQTELAMPLYWNIVPDDYRARVAENLNKRVIADGTHLDVGLLGSKALLGALSDNGYMDTAYRLATQETYPSWGYWIRQGATSLHENWKTDVIIDNSLNHIMFGEVGAWLYKSVAGLAPDTDVPGFKKTHITPYFPEDMDALDVSYNTPHGLLKLSWKRDASIHYHLSVPIGMTVVLHQPTGEVKELSAGDYTFNWN